MQEIIDIYSKGEYPSNVLSNFYPRDFSFYGIKIGSAEGFLQSLKFKNPKKQVRICALGGKAAKKKGGRKFLWKITGNVYWNGHRIRRDGPVFFSLVYKFYVYMYLEDENFSKALKSTCGKKLVHSIGKHDKRKTILTEEEIIGILERIRDLL